MSEQNGNTEVRHVVNAQKLRTDLIAMGERSPIQTRDSQLFPEGLGCFNVNT